MKRKALYPKPHIKKGDVVEAISGEDAGTGKTGKVLRVIPEQGRALVEGFNFVKKSLRKSQDNPKGGIIEKEAPVALSNLKLHQEGESRSTRKSK